MDSYFVEIKCQPDSAIFVAESGVLESKQEVTPD